MLHPTRVRGILSAMVIALGISCFCGAARAQIDLDPAAGQSFKAPPIRIEPVRDLAFGSVIPGVETRVDHTDPNSGLWLLKVTNDSLVDITFQSLPPAINGTGDSMPVRFESNQALIVVPQLGTSFVFDPTSSITVLVGNPGRVIVYLGGVASPRGDQSPGAYASPVTVDAVYSNGPVTPPM